MKQLTISILALFLFSISFGQETTIKDPDTIPGFEGQIHYKITHSIIDPDLKGDVLADSAVLTVKYPWAMMTYHGRIVDSLENTTIWNAETGDLFLISPSQKSRKKLVETFSAPTSILDYGKSSIILDFPTRKYSIKHSDPVIYQSVWANEQIYFPFSSDSLPPNTPPFIDPRVKGIPLKLSAKLKTQTSTSTAVQVQRGTIDETVFHFADEFETTDFEKVIHRLEIIEK